MKKMFIISSIILLMLLMVYVVILFDVRILKKQFKYTLCRNINHDDIKNTLLNNYYEYFDFEETKDIKVKLKTLFTFHNFKNGIIYFKYNREFIDAKVR